MYKTSLFWLLLVIFVPHVFPFFAITYAAETETIQYISDRDSSVSGILVPEPSPGVVPVSGNDLIGITVDNRKSSLSLAASAQGRATVSARLPALQEGRHTARLSSREPGGSLKASKQLLFYYDTTPPELDLIFPESPNITRHVLSFLVEFSDEGSGISSEMDEIEMSAHINGIEADVELVADDNKRFFLIEHSGKTGAQGDTNYTLKVSLKDRAGNEATLSRVFKTDEILHTAEHEKKTCESAAGSTYQFDVTTRQEISFPINSRLYSIAFTRDKRVKTVEIEISSGEELDPTVLGFLKMSSDHPQISVRRLSGSGTDRARFQVTQERAVMSLNALGYLTVEYPETLIVDYDWQCTQDGRDMEPSIKSAVGSSALVSFKIPVHLYWENSREYEIEATDEDGTFLIHYSTWTNPSSSAIDKTASFLSFKGSNYFFNEISGRFVAETPVEKEGYYAFDVTLVSIAGAWKYIEKNVMTEEHEILVNLGAPEILSFLYNTEKEQFEAVIKDIGTPDDDLVIELSVDGYGKRQVTLQQMDSGELQLVSPFPLPHSILNANLSITDLAQNSTKKSCKVFGIPPENSDGDGAVSSYWIKQQKETKSGDDSRYKTILSLLSDGLSLVRRCPVEKVVLVSDYFQSGLDPDKTTRVTSFYPYETYRKEGSGGGNLLHYDSAVMPTVLVNLWDPDAKKMISVKPSSQLWRRQNHHIYSFQFCSNTIEDTQPPEIKGISFNPSNGELTAIISDHGRPASKIRTTVKATISDHDQFGLRTNIKELYTPDKEPLIGPFTQKSPGLSTYSRKKRILDTLVIYRTDRGLRTEMSSLQRSRAPRATLKEKEFFIPVLNNYISYKNKVVKTGKSHKSVRGHGLQGRLKATIPIPPLALGERFDIKITARDGSGNSSTETLFLAIPQRPPVVNLELMNTENASMLTNSGGSRNTTHFRAKAVDESGLDLGQTYFEIDDIRISPLSHVGQGGLNYNYGLRASLSFSDVLEKSYQAIWVDEYIALYGSRLEEGKHRALFLATDTVGLSARQQLDFSVEYLPHIYDFASKPKAIQDIGGPAFTALIIDGGKDLQLEGIRFFIDKQEIDRDKLYYDQVSGYFSVSGPLELGSGYHKARLVAADNNNHQAEETLRFVIGEDMIALSTTGELELDSVNIWELEYDNNDGQANPGEMIRLFPTLMNTSPVPLRECTAVLSAEDNRLNVVVYEISQDILSAGTTTTLLRGFDLQIGDDILDATISDPYDTNFQLAVSCEDQDWELPFTLPIYRPSLPRDIDSEVTVELDSTPRTTTAAETRLIGTALSSSSYIRDVTVRVSNNEIPLSFLDRHSGRFEATLPLEPGSNVIQITASDESGALGYKTIFINSRSELNVTIDSIPRSTDNQNITIQGTVTSSASTVERLLVTVNGREQPANWHERSGRYDAEINLDSGSNLVVVEAWDETGSHGRASTQINRASVQINYDSKLIVRLDSLPPATTDSSVLIGGVVESSAPVDRVILEVNGTSYTADYNASSNRFSATINLDVGGNSIIARAFNASGASGEDQTYITRNVPFIPPTISITSPADGLVFQCDPITISGTFDPGSSDVEEISVSTPPEDFECGDVRFDADTFTVECDVNLSAGDTIYRVEIRTIMGTTMSDSVLVRTRECS